MRHPPRILLLFLKSTLVGVAAHEKELLGSGKITFNARKLHVLALSTKWHGRKFDDGKRASDVLMMAVFNDIESRDGTNMRVFAIVHRENQSALRLCARHGLVKQISPPHPDYKWLVTN
jgi:hypothetical protein